MMPEGPEVRTLTNKLKPAIGMRLLNINFISGRYVNHQRPVGFDSFRKTMSDYDASKDEYNDKTDLIRQWNCKGKFIWIELDDGVRDDPADDYLRSVWITLGMTGRFFSEKEVDKSSPSLRWYLELYDYNSQKTRRIYYSDRRNFGTLKFSLSAAELEKKIASLGPDMLHDDTTEDIFLECLSSYRARSSPNICKLLMNQKVCSIFNFHFLIVFLP